jgi:hypothetical protein
MISQRNGDAFLPPTAITFLERGNIMRILSNEISRIVLSLIASVAASSGLIAAAEPAALQITEGSNSVTVRAGDCNVLEYRTTASPFKPYVRQLFTPGGVQILRDSPSDHKHHHALMFAIEANGVNFWEEIPGAGVEKPRGSVATATRSFLDTSSARIDQTLDWTNEQGKQILVERREVGVVIPSEPAPVTLLLWNAELSPATGLDAVKLGGHHYFGLGMRFLTSMDTGGRFFNSSKQPGEVVAGSERLVPAKWCAYTAKANGKPVTVAIFDHPSNPRHPNKIFTMTPPFAYLSATLNLWKEPLVLKADAKLKLSYAVAVWDGEASAEKVESLYEKWSMAK